ncbi:MAG: hypothetical protein K2X99_04695, partial [Gemmatimonadaceae bacterium]|nr:hypothetical protein [Gemmatimonadaceae bacterium]
GDAVTAGAATVPPIHVLGFSQGATTASRWVALGRTAPTRFIAWGGAIAPELPLTPDAKLRQSALVLVLGDRDKFISAERAAEEEGRLAAAGVPFSTVRFAGGHRLDDATLSALAGA